MSPEERVQGGRQVGYNETNKKGASRADPRPSGNRVPGYGKSCSVEIGLEPPTYAEFGKWSVTLQPQGAAFTTTGVVTGTARRESFAGSRDVTLQGCRRCRCVAARTCTQSHAGSFSRRLQHGLSSGENMLPS